MNNATKLTLHHLVHRSVLVHLSTLLSVLLVSAGLQAQQPAANSFTTDSFNYDKWVSSVIQKSNKLEEKIISGSEKMLTRLQRREEKIYHKILKGKDSLQAKAALNDINSKYTQLRSKLRSPSIVNGKLPYIAKLDTISTALKFLDNNSTGKKIQEALSKTQSLHNRFGKADDIQQFIKERRELLKQQLQKLGMMKELKKINKEVYYYSAQIKEYKEILKDSKKTERKAIELLSKTKPFKDFMRKNSQLASLFRLPGSNDDPSNIASLSGLQTRAQVNNLIAQQLSAGGPDARAQFSQNIQQAQSQLNELKDKVLKAGGSGSTEELPDFKPNSQKTKPFFQRLEYGTNVQTQKASSFFPVTTDIGLSVGYKLNDKSIIGIGASYKVGLGRGWNNIRFSHEGMGLRSFIDLKIKGSLYVSGGYEQNYRAGFSDFSQLRDMNGWQQSGLIGVSKLISLKTKFFKKTKMQLLWDMLSYQQLPRTQPLLFRVGYAF